MIYIGTQCLEQHGLSSKAKQTQLPRSRFEIVPRSLRFLPPRIWDRYPCQLPMMFFKGSRVEKLHVSKAEEGLLSRSLRTFKMGESGGGVGRWEEKQIACLFPPLSRYPTLQEHLRHSWVLVILQVLLLLPIFSQATSLERAKNIFAEIKQKKKNP